ncbi:MAG: CoA transferase [Dehalococcoidia bacterium]|nr:CoA transferase [Dehalococcoidia bacterium]
MARSVAPRAPAASSAPAALDGIAVLECASLVAAPYCSKLLAELGADVVKIEPPQGDPSRRLGPFPHGGPDAEASALFLYCNIGKRSVTLDVRHPVGAALLRRLAAQADVMIEDAGAGVMDALGLGYAALAAENPRLVYLSITPFGLTGPYAAYRATDLGICAAGGEAFTMPGTLSTALFPDREPVRAGGYITAYDCGVTASVAVLSALMQREVTGVGQRIDLSQQEAAMAIARESPLQRYPGYGKVVDRQAQNFFGGMFPCKDGYVTLSPRENAHWRALCDAMQRPGLADDPRFSSFDARHHNSDALNAELRAWAADRPKQWIYREVASRGCPASAFSSVEELLASEQLASRGFFHALPHPRAGRLRYPGASYAMSRTPARHERAAPLLGEHNAAVLCGRVGLAPQEMTILRAQGAI